MIGLTRLSCICTCLIIREVPFSQPNAFILPFPHYKINVYKKNHNTNIDLTSNCTQLQPAAPIHLRTWDFRLYTVLQSRSSIGSIGGGSFISINACDEFVNYFLNHCRAVCTFHSNNLIKIFEFLAARLTTYICNTPSYSNKIPLFIISSRRYLYILYRDRGEISNVLLFIEGGKPSPCPCWLINQVICSCNKSIIINLSICCTY